MESSKCEYHFKKITHYCVSNDCYEPLCQSCLIFHHNIHSQLNEKAKIYEIESIFNQCKTKTNKIILDINELKDNLEEFKEYIENEWIGSIKNVRYKLKNTKLKLEETINSYFKQLEINICSNYMEQAKRRSINKIKFEIDRVNNKKSIYNKFLEKMNKESFEFNLINQLLDKDLDELNKKYSLNYKRIKLNKKNLLFNDNLINYNLNEHNINTLDSLLNNIINFEIKTNTSFNLEQSHFDVTIKDSLENFESKTIIKMNKDNFKLKDKIQKDIYSNKYSEEESIDNESQENIQQLNLEKVNKIQNIDEIEENFDYDNDDDGNIKLIDYFLSKDSAMLHFFESNSKNLHIIKLNKNINNKFKKIELNIDFNIPRHHKSIIDPDGYIFLSGGILFNPDNSKQEYTSLFMIYVENENTLAILSNMNYQRAIHGMIYHNDCIYVVGGVTKNDKILKTCEKFNITKKEWEDIADLNYPTINPILSCNNSYIFKIGGRTVNDKLLNLIEVYSIEEDIWFEIENRFNDGFNKIPSTASCYQINDNNIILFGGNFDKYDQKNDNFQFLTFNSNFDHVTIELIDEFRLPHAEAFWNPQCIAYEEDLYCLQNVPDINNKKLIKVGNRNILKFNFSSKWKILK